eukprot:16443361-Heterocapsa_arctica.AAC.1
MIKIIDKDKTLIKATPRGGLPYRKRQLPYDGKGPPEWKKLDKGGNDKGDGKGTSKGSWAGGEKADGRGQMGGFSAGGADFWGMNHPDGGAAGVQMGGVTDPGPPPAQPTMIWNGPPVNWNVG